MPGRCVAATYQRRQPEDSVLYRTVQAHLDTFLARTAGDDGGSLPGFVTRELRAYPLPHGDIRALSPAAVREVLKAEGFAALPRRLDEERSARLQTSTWPCW